MFPIKRWNLTFTLSLYDTEYSTTKAYDTEYSTTNALYQCMESRKMKLLHLVVLDHEIIFITSC